MPTSRRIAPLLFWAVVSFRCVGALAALLLINALLPLGSSLVLLFLSSVVGVIGASLAAHSRITPLGMLCATGIVAATPPLLLSVTNRLLSLFDFASLRIEAFQMHLSTCGLAFAIAGLLTWFFWRVRLAITLEALFLIILSVALFSGHRDFHLDRPKIINSLAWQLGLDQLSFLFVLGSLLLAASLLYLYLASLATRPRAEDSSIQRVSSQRRLLTSGLALVAVAALIWVIQHTLYGHFNQIMLTRVSNGVGINSKEGVSPLSFQSALGTSSQPVALVRLEGDYNNNPFSPMMYLRETALSSFNGKEMVFSGRAFDTDVPVIRPSETFTGKEDAELSQRTPLVQSVYLLADHDNIFALDYPVSIVQLKNPKSTRFKNAYRAYSIGPAFELPKLEQQGVGDPRWTPDVRDHFLATHPDPRYKEVAERLTQGVTDPVEKARTLTAALSKSSIYTLTPNHQVAPGDDPVAPYLFGDHRGYCVHFAHAMVYMLRALGIPARIGTGYMTDLSQAKDGHILLRMSDRHAWSEVYVTGIGWVPFDIQPEQVENHAETQVDAKMLEELMGILQPGEELLPNELVKDEKGVEEEPTVWLPDPRTAIPVLYILAALFVSLKLVMRHGWRLARSPQAKLRWAYIAALSALHDAGFSREFGETRLEYAARLQSFNIEPLSRLVVTQIYSESSRLNLEEVLQVITVSGSPLRKLPRWRRSLAAINPSSVCKFLGGGAW